MTLGQLMCAIDGYRDRRKEDWEMIRVQCAYSLAPYSKNGNIKFDEIILPIDDLKAIADARPKATLTKHSREEVKAEYERSGMVISENELDRIFNGK